MKHSRDFQHLLLDIEGTTCPVSFVSEILFPYASAQLLPYLQRHRTNASIRSLLTEIHAAWQQDANPEAIALAISMDARPKQDARPIQDARPAQDERPDQADWSDLPEFSPEKASAYLSLLIKQDRKLTALKDLQGLIWEEGYKQGKLIASLYADVPKALQEWHRKGIALSVYSSGSIQAQKLLYSHTTTGDLSHCFSEWFDTRTGPKDESESYVSIAKSLHTSAEDILFISDSPRELSAATSAGMSVLFSRRPGNPHLHAEGFSIVETFEGLMT
jgi:enolase-phosphatase E1